jgi:hypothetical protein
MRPQRFPTSDFLGSISMGVIFLNETGFAVSTNFFYPSIYIGGPSSNSLVQVAKF